MPFDEDIFGDEYPETDIDDEGLEPETVRCDVCGADNDENNRYCEFCACEL